MTKKLSNSNFSNDLSENNLEELGIDSNNMSNFSSSTPSSSTANEFMFSFKSLEVKNNNNITSKINRKKKLFLNHLTLLENEIASINNNKEFKRQKFVDDILITYDNLFIQCDLHLNKLKGYNNKINLNYNKKKTESGFGESVPVSSSVAPTSTTLPQNFDGFSNPSLLSSSINVAAAAAVASTARNH